MMTSCQRTDELAERGGVVMQKVRLYDVVQHEIQDFLLGPCQLNLAFNITV